MKRAARLRRTLALGSLALVACLALTGMGRDWGNGGQQYVAALAVEDLPGGPLKALYQTNLGWLETNSTFADRWKARQDVAEPARHFLHPEAFGPGVTPKRSPHSYAEAVRLRGYDSLRSDGVLPWTIERHYKLLVDAWEDNEWDAVLFESAMLSHYVSDAHEPFHATQNNDGQLSNPPQTGIDRRFSVGVVERSVRLADLKSRTATYIRDPLNHAFDNLQESWDNVTFLLASDRSASDNGLEQNGEGYWQAFIPRARPVAIERLQDAGATLSGLLLRAWAEAGHPRPPVDFLMTDRFMPYAPASVEGDGPSPSGSAALPYLSSDSRDAARGNAHFIQVSSPTLKRDVAATILLPADYAATQRRYPVLYILHGSSGSERDWIAKSGIAAYVQNLPLIVVMPDGANTWYIDSPGQGDYETFFTKELIPTIDSSFRTLTQRQARAIAGNSMGGYGAWRLALDHPDLFQSTASLSGAMDMGVVDPHEGEPNEWITALYGGTTAEDLRSYYRDSLYGRLERLDARGRWRGPWLYFDAGSNDYLLSGDHHMEQFLLERSIPYEYAEFDQGDHSWLYWDTHIRDALQFTLRHLAAPTAR